MKVEKISRNGQSHIATLVRGGPIYLSFVEVKDDPDYWI